MNHELNLRGDWIEKNMPIHNKVEKIIKSCFL